MRHTQVHMQRVTHSKSFTTGGRVQSPRSEVNREGALGISQTFRTTTQSQTAAAPAPAAAAAAAAAVAHDLAVALLLLGRLSCCNPRHTAHYPAATCGGTSACCAACSTRGLRRHRSANSSSALVIMRLPSRLPGLHALTAAAASARVWARGREVVSAASALLLMRLPPRLRPACAPSLLPWPL